MNVIKIAHIPIDDLDLIQMKNSDGLWAVCMDHDSHFLAHSQYNLLRVEQKNTPRFLRTLVAEKELITKGVSCF